MWRASAQLVARLASLQSPRAVALVAASRAVQAVAVAVGTRCRGLTPLLLAANLQRAPMKKLAAGPLRTTCFSWTWVA